MRKLIINTTLNYSPNFDVIKRKPKEIKFLILHYTGMKKEKDAINKLTNEKSKVSCHYFIKNNGEILTLVPDLYTSWHAGISAWKNFKFYKEDISKNIIENPLQLKIQPIKKTDKELELEKITKQIIFIIDNFKKEYYRKPSLDEIRDNLSIPVKNDIICNILKKLDL